MAAAIQVRDMQRLLLPKTQTNSLTQSAPISSTETRMVKKAIRAVPPTRDEKQHREAALKIEERRSVKE